jgi:hypothetical protein
MPIGIAGEYPENVLKFVDFDKTTESVLREADAATPVTAGRLVLSANMAPKRTFNLVDVRTFYFYIVIQICVSLNNYVCLFNYITCIACYYVNGICIFYTNINHS